jgi:hypothetical protein
VPLKGARAVSLLTRLRHLAYLAAAATCTQLMADPLLPDAFTDCPTAPSSAVATVDANGCDIDVALNFADENDASDYAESESDGAMRLRDGRTVYVARQHFQSPVARHMRTLSAPTLAHWKAVFDVDVVDARHALLRIDANPEPHDTSYEEEQHLLVVNHDVWRKIGANAATRTIPFTRRPKVAVLDTGIRSHKEFWRSGSSGTFGSSLIRWYEADPDQQGVGCVGGHCCQPISEPANMSPHATQVAGLIAADDDMTGISGIGEVAELMSIRVPEVVPMCFSRKRLMAAFECAIQRGADIINISMQSERGTPCPRDLYRTMRQTPTHAISDRQHPLVVVAAGNRGCNHCDPTCGVWPGGIELPWVVTVEALEINDERVADSNHGRTVDIAVPAPTRQQLCTTTSEAPANPNTQTCTNGYTRFAQTSAAAALVTGASTRIWGHPNFDRCRADQIRLLLKGFGKPILQKEGSSCLLQMGFLYDVRRDDEGSAMNLCQCPELTDTVECGDLQTKKPLCGSTAAIVQP